MARVAEREHLAADTVRDYFKSAEFCSMCGRRYCPMHNVRDIDWDDVRAIVQTRRAQHAAAGA